MKTSSKSSTSAKNLVTKQNLANAVCFYRISSKKQENQRQIENCQAYCTYLKATIVQEFKETISGATKLKDRPRLLEFLQYIEANPPKFVVISELSRLGRSQEIHTVLSKLKELNICFIALKESIRTIDEDGKPNETQGLMINIMAAINQFELSTIAYRVKSGRNIAITTKGAWGGGSRVTFGYTSENTFIGDRKINKLIINPKEAEVVKLIYKQFTVDGFGIDKICRFLNAEGIASKTGKPWTYSTCKAVLTNTIYDGRRRFEYWKKVNGHSKKTEDAEKNLLDTPDLKILNAGVFADAQQKLIERRNKNFDFNKQKKYDYLLDNRLVMCSCGKSYIGEARRNHYKCSSNRFGSGCGSAPIKIKWLDYQIQYHLVKNWSNLLQDNSVLSNKIGKLEIDIKLLQQKAKEESKLIEKYNYRFDTGRMEQPEYDLKYPAAQKLLDEINKQIKQAEKQLVDLQKQKQTVLPSLKVKDDKIIDLGNLIDKPTIHKIVKSIVVQQKAKKQEVQLSLINGSSFKIDVKH